MATLVTTVVLLIAVTIVVLLASKVGVMDQRISANEYRHKQAFANAEAGLDYAASYLSANPKLSAIKSADGWISCSGNESLFPCTLSGAQNTLGSLVGGVIVPVIPAPADISPAPKSFLVSTADNIIAVGTGQSDDASGEAIAQVAYVESAIIIPGELPPLMVPSGDLSGNFNIVPNPNGGGPGVPVSVWAKDSLNTAGANWKTCQQGEFQDGGVACMDIKGDGETGDSWSACSCSAELSNSTNVGSDVVLYPPDDFPTSPFAYVFGNNPSDTTEIAELKDEVKARAQDTGLLLDDCSNIDTAFAAETESPLVWVSGNCDVNSSITIGSRSKPIILVVEGDVKINASAEIWGLLVGLSNFSLNGGPVVHGSAISEGPSDLTNGNYSQVYDKELFDKLKDDTTNTDLAKVQYSWRDFVPE
jgi:hypothetical protein